MPIGGYTKIIEKMLEDIEVKLNYDYKFHKKEVEAKHVVYTGVIDEYFNFCYGPLEYRKVEFKDEILDTPKYQGNEVVNYTEYEVP